VLGDYAEDIRGRHLVLGSAQVERIASQFEGGATIVLQLSSSSISLAKFCRELERELAHPVQANAYYTPASAQGFKVHHDTHDVLCLQVEGEALARVSARPRAAAQEPEVLARARRAR
jgi:hypothetical protein